VNTLAPAIGTNAVSSQVVPGIPPLIYSWRVLSVLQQTGPFIESLILRRRIRQRDQHRGVPADLRYRSWNDDGGYGEYILRCERLNVPSKRDSATATWRRKGQRQPTKRDITIDSIEAFLTRIEKNDPENAVERSALSTCIALLGRTAIYTGREATWKGDIGIAV
jgi:hypothetical protein